MNDTRYRCTGCNDDNDYHWWINVVVSPQENNKNKKRYKAPHEAWPSITFKCRLPSINLTNSALFSVLVLFSYFQHVLSLYTVIGVSPFYNKTQATRNYHFNYRYWWWGWITSRLIIPFINRSFNNNKLTLGIYENKS